METVLRTARELVLRILRPEGSYCHPAGTRASYVVAWNPGTARGIALFKKAVKAGAPLQNRTDFAFYGSASQQPGEAPWLKLTIAEQAVPGVVKDTTKLYDDVYVLIGSLAEIQAQANALKW